MSKSSQPTDFEKLVKNIYEELSPNSIVTHDDKILDKESDSYRQIDVTIKSRIAGHDYLTIVEARDHKRPQNIKAIEEFAGK